MTKRYVTAIAAIAGILMAVPQAQAVVFLDAGEFENYCADKYGSGAVGEGPTVGSGNRVSLECITGANESHEEDVDSVCHDLTGHVTWVNDGGRIVCIGEAAFGQNEGRGSFSYPN